MLLFKITTSLELHRNLNKCAFSWCGHLLKDLYYSNLDFEFLDEAEHVSGQYGYIIVSTEEGFISLKVDFGGIYSSSIRNLEKEEFDLVLEHKKRLETKSLLTNEEQIKLTRFNQILESI